mgnify:CR=1 FL=1
MNSPNQHIPVNNIDPGKNVGDGEGSVDLIVSTPGREGTWGGGVWIGDVKGDDVVFIYDLDEVRQHLREWLLDPENR